MLRGLAGYQQLRRILRTLIGWFPRTTVSPASASVNRCRVYRLNLATAGTHS